MKITIQKLNFKEVETQYGLKKKVGVLFNKTWYGTFAADWNKHWKEGMEIDVEVESKQGSDGKMYHNILKPDPLRAYEDRFVMIEGRLKFAEAKIAALENKSRSPGEPPPFDDEELPF